MVYEGWCRPGVDFLMDLEGCSTADFPGVEYMIGSDGTVIFERLEEESNRCGGAPLVVPGIASRCIGKRCD